MSKPASMRTLRVSSWGSGIPPTVSSVPEPPISPADSTRVRILASALTNLVRSQANGTHYSMTDVPLPYVPGIDATGFTPDNKLVYVNLFYNKPIGGGFAEYVNAVDRAITPIPISADASDADVRDLGVKVASLMNPAMSSWMALKYRAHVDDFTSASTSFTVLVLGATSTSGRIAALFAKHLGAKSVIGVARNSVELERLKNTGTIEEAITLNKEDVNQTDLTILSKSVDNYPLIVLDYIYGPATLATLNALPRSANQAENLEIRYVHIGGLGRQTEFALPGVLLRSKNITISGAGPGSWSMAAYARETPNIVKAISEVIPSEGWETEYSVAERKLEDVEAAWADEQSRTVFAMV